MPSLSAWVAALALSASVCTATTVTELREIRALHRRRMALHRRAGPSATPQPESVIGSTSFNGCPAIPVNGVTYAANQAFLDFVPNGPQTAVDTLFCVRAASSQHADPGQIYQDADLTFQCALRGRPARLRAQSSVFTTASAHRRRARTLKAAGAPRAYRPG